MTAVNDWVPTAAFIEHYVLEEALENDVTIKRATSIVLPRFGIKSTGPFLHRQTRLLGMLYTLLVFPQEQWKRQCLMEIVVERVKSDNELFESIRKLLSTSLLRSIRNVVSHARIDFGDETITFRDGKNDKSPNFEVTFTVQEAVNLVLALGRAFHETAQLKESLTKAGSTKT